jgi:hypothetical protein
MTVLDQVFQGKQGGDMLFSAGVEVGKTKGRVEFANHLCGALRADKETARKFAEFVHAELLKFQRGEL